MKNKAVLIDHGKSLLIVLLLISAVFLLFKAMLFRPDKFFDNIGNFLGAQPAPGGYEGGESELISSAASPCYILATTEDGSHYASKYDGTNKEKLFSQFSPYLGMALGSADTPVQINEAQWQSALRQSGVFFDYIYPQPLSAMGSWLGTSPSGGTGEYEARRLYLGSNGDVMCLYFINAHDHSIYRCSTALSFSDIASKIAELPMGSANFAFELGETYENIDPYFIFSYETLQLRAMTSSSPIRDGYSLSELFSIFEMNSRTTSECPEKDGSYVYVDGEKSLRIDVSGKLSFSVAEGKGISIPKADIELEDCIALVNSIAQKSIGASCGEATVGLSGISNGGVSEACTLYFSYFIDGIPVKLSGGLYAVSAKFSAGSIVRLDLVYRSYTHTGEMLMPLPEKLACAMAAATGGEPLLQYEDKNDGVSCAWIVN